jgi:hypothetical protein
MCPVGALAVFPSGQQKSCSLKRAVAHSPGQQRCYRPVVGPEAHTRVAPLDFFNSSAVPNKTKRHNLLCLQILMGEDDQQYFLQGLRVVAQIPRNLQNFCAAQYQRTIVRRGGRARLLRQDAR